jgi:hypothetical protein
MPQGFLVEPRIAPHAPISLKQEPRLTRRQKLAGGAP